VARPTGSVLADIAGRVRTSTTGRSATIEVLLIALHSHGRSKPLIDELEKLQERGVVRLVDVIVIRKESAESVQATGRSWLKPRDIGRFRKLMSDAIGFHHTDDAGVAQRVRYEGTSALLGANDVASIAEMLRPGESAVAVIIEHRWASRLGRLIRSSDISLVEDYMLTPEILHGTGPAISMW
jgi:hypothetical protein